MGFDPTPYIRYALDFGMVGVNVVGLKPYQVDLITIQNDQIGFNDVSTGRSVNVFRLLVADGYRFYAPGDGYLNPKVTQESGEQLMVSGGQLTSITIRLGPFCFPYNVNNFAGGKDPALFQPTSGQVYVRIMGPGMAAEGNFFDVMKVATDNMGNLTYYLILTATQQNPKLV
jgi:hypothetical protein